MAACKPDNQPPGSTPGKEGQTGRHAQLGCATRLAAMPAGPNVIINTIDSTLPGCIASAKADGADMIVLLSHVSPVSQSAVTGMLAARLCCLHCLAACLPAGLPASAHQHPSLAQAAGRRQAAGRQAGSRQQAVQCLRGPLGGMLE